jgi:hypothetical protein
VDVRRYGAIPDDAADDTDAIQKALDGHAKVLVPKGVFLISRPIRLGPANHLLGIGKTASILRENREWRGVADAPLVTTAADPNARSSLSFVMLETQSPGRTAVDWHAGGASIVRDIMTGPVSAYYGKHVGHPGQTFRISDTGGGRWYATAAEWGNLYGSTYDPAYSHLVVEGTSQPLAFYGLNLERDAVWPQAVLRDSRNIDIFYFKTEANEWPKGTTPAGVLLVQRCHNLRIFAMTGYAHPRDSALVTLEASDGVLLAQVAGFQPSKDFSNVTDSRSTSSQSVSGQTPLALFKRSPAMAAEAQVNSNTTKPQ